MGFNRVSKKPEESSVYKADSNDRKQIKKF
jgi:hypothetical protein